MNGNAKSHFKKIQNFKCNYAVEEFTQYESTRTGMRVAMINRAGPKVNGYFAFATEIHDDSGAPHTLEHLCFMGSRSYEYKGVLDRLATRAYSATNAWTGTDQTVYSLDTAGWDGFAQILPIYLEHCLLPTLTSAGCYTEIHHVDGTGKDAGVVYCEMQAVQNQSNEIISMESNRLLYPEGNGFRYETGGMMDQLRVLTVDRIREFHMEMYQPKNLRVILNGEINHAETLAILDKFEDSILDAMPSIDSPFKRPFIDSEPTPDLKETVIKRVEFPEDDESVGEVHISMFGPALQNTLETRAIDILGRYLAGSSVAILENTLVQKEELASGVYYWTNNRPRTVISFVLNGVKTKKLAAAEGRFFEVVEEATSKPFDMDYMHDCLKLSRRQLIYWCETSDTIFSTDIIEDHLFGSRDGKDLENNLDLLKVYDIMETWTDKQWRDLAIKYILHNKHVSILGVPSAKLSEKLKAEETARVEAQQEKYGEEGLKDLARKLEEAQKENDRPVPDEILDAFSVPCTESIHFVPSITARSGLAQKMGHLDNDIQKLIDKDSSNDLPLFIHFEHIPTNFIHFHLVLNTSVIPVELKPLLPLYMENFFDTPVERDGKLINFEQVVTQLERETVSYSLDSGSQLNAAETLLFKFVVEPDKYETAVKWLRDLLFNGIFTAERLKPTLNKILKELPEEKRQGDDMLSAVNDMIHLTSQSSSRAQNTLVKAAYLKQMQKLLASSPEEVISKLESLRKSLLTFSNMRLFVIADLTKLANPVSTWKHLTKDLDTTQELLPLDTRRRVQIDAEKSPGKLNYIVPMPAIDSSFGKFTTKGLDSWQHPQLPALMVATAYLDAVEGPLWVAVRGTGLAYGTYFTRSIDAGILSFSVYRSPNVCIAYSAAKKVIEEFASGKRDFGKHALEGAISTIVCGFANEQPTAITAAVVGFANQVIKGIPKDWGTEILKKVREVTVEDLTKVMQEVILPVFTAGRADVVVTCSPLMEVDLRKGFEDAGFRPEVRTLASFHDGYGFGGEEEEEEEDTSEEGSGGSDEDEEDDDDVDME
ncbi:putative zinc metalloprotease [Tothia fuscella]|uniref:Presequence protease, mitochondrial n=1 Tax=Tothia fuscella TaxID=1048955 RepID=A0A9P4NYX4_9PEZI|nr:putative zinc metalloprotease [Tothia fuscella]